jgi:hypothetical protein
MPSVAAALNVRVLPHSTNVVKRLCGEEWKPSSGRRLLFGVELELECSKRGLDEGAVKEWAYDDDAYNIPSIREALEDGWSYAWQYDYHEVIRPYILSQVYGVVGTDWCVGKEDGSLDCGIEFVSRPATLQDHKRRWKPLFDAKLPYLRAERTCGLHIHVGKHNLKSEEIGQAIALTTHPNWKGLIVKLAGRESASFARIFQKSKSNYRAQQEGKYDAVNTVPNATVEWRLFAATLEWEEFERRLEFVSSVLWWARTKSVNDDAMDGAWESYAEWLGRDVRESDRHLAIAQWVAEHPYDPSKAPPRQPIVTAPSTGRVLAQDQYGRAYTDVEQLRNTPFTLRYLSPEYYHYVPNCACEVCIRTLRSVSNVTWGPLCIEVQEAR